MLSMRAMRTLLLLLLLGSLGWCQACVGEDGHLVDWWIVVKPPKNAAYGYFDSRMNGNISHFKVISTPFNSPSGAVYKTMHNINSVFDIETVAWSDQPPNGNAGSTYAHSKGFMAFSRTAKKGFLIEHSLPQFPEFFQGGTVNLTNKPNSNVYGQTLLCQTQSLSSLEVIATKYQTVKPYVYFSRVNSSATPRLPNIELLSNRSNPYHKAPTPLSYMNYQLGTSQVKAIFKAASYNVSVFGDHAKKADGLTKMLNSSIYVEAWRGDNGDFCDLNSREADNVMYINALKMGSQSWKRTADHSKWVISTDGHWSCVGGMNRQVSQWSRGGEFFCINSRNLNQAFSSLILDKSSCGKKGESRVAKKLFRRPLLKRSKSWSY